jgi:O-antigen/teichoic acid export membrane protein
MVIALWLGFGLVALALVTAVCQILGQLTMVTLAYHACPGLKNKWSYVDKGTIKELYVYSGKTLLPTISELLLNQTVVVLITRNIGLSALAIFMRPRSLLRQIDSLERKMAMILIPTTSSLESCGDMKEIENLLVKSARYSMYLVIPTVLVLVIFGGEVMRLWMGADFANWILPAVFAVGFVGTAIQTPILYMLEGMNAHGKAGVGQFIGSALSAAAVLIALRFFHGGLTAAALAITIPLFIVNVLYLPMLLCRRLGHGLGSFYRKVAVAPLLHTIPFAICLGIGRWLFDARPIAAMVVCAVGCVALGIFYWRSVLPPSLKSSIGRLGKKIGIKPATAGAK